ncbi:MAG: rhodanese-like domain-containing protein [Clostridiaceae bacterium]
MLFEQLNPHSCRTYLIADEEKGLAALVDPVIDHFGDYTGLLEKRKLKLKYAIDTHTHADHISACPALTELAGCDYVMHENAPAKCVSFRVKDGDTLALGSLELKIIYTPGHTKDSICIMLKDILLTGDFLFLDDAGGGRDDLPGGDMAEHWHSINILDKLPDSLIVYPAHEYGKRQPSGLGKQRQSNPHLYKRSREEFLSYIGSLGVGPAEWMKDVIKANYACSTDPKAAWIPEDTNACQIMGAVDKAVNELSIDYIKPVELKEKLASGEKDILLLDVRESYELSDSLGHIEGIVNIPVGSLAGRLKELEGSRNKDVVVICRSGSRAATGAHILMKAGFGKVRVLKGGMIAWRNE